jgi:cytidylate kinase
MTVVTISALYGAGGSFVAPALARRLDVPLLGRPAKPSECESEAGSEGSSGGTLLSRVASLAVSWGTPSGLTAEELIPDEVARRELEREVRALAETGRGVVLGRGAAGLLRGDPRVLHVLLEGPEEARVLQAMAMEGIDLASARRRQTRIDRMRRAYLEGLYGIDPNEPGTFQLVLDSTAFALEDCVEIVADAAQRFGRQ